MFNKFGFLFSCLLLLPSLVVAQEYKIGFVNTGKVLRQAPQAIAVEQRLKASFLSREKDLKVKQQALFDLEARINNDSAILSSAEKRKLEREFRLKVSQLKFEQQEFKEDQNLKRNEEIRLLQNTIAKVLTKIGFEQKFDLILTEGVTFVSDKIEITDLVIKALKQEIEEPPSKQ
ncbi:MAG: OmpH family outer membrane protein [Gammaproteobacteria bacterium]|nr:OmpH family outer membrane protein [Gammaproteobacteria bacterium]